MGCGCGGGVRQAPAEAPPEAAPGEWVAVYPSGRSVRFSGAHARRKAQREAIATGGRAYRMPDAPEGDGGEDGAPPGD